MLEMKLFKKKEKVDNPLAKELKKYNRKRRAKIKELLKQYDAGMILKPDEDIDNKQHIIEQRQKWANS